MTFYLDSLIPEEKFTRYLLVKRDFDDKSRFLARGGYSVENYFVLINHIQNLVKENDAVEERTDDYGTFYRVTGIIPGADHMPLNVTTIWLRRKIDNKYQFITLIPAGR